MNKLFSTYLQISNTLPLSKKEKKNVLKFQMEVEQVEF